MIRYKTQSPTVRTALVLAGGWGTRFLPLTKVVPKEMLPLNGVPAIHYVVEECLAAGLEQIIIVTRPQCGLVQRYFEPSPLLDQHLARKRMPTPLPLLHQAKIAQRLTFIEEQPDSNYGNALPLLQLRDQLMAEPAFAVLFADDVIFGPTPAIGELFQAFDDHQAETAIAMQRIPKHQLTQFGNLSLGGELGSHPFRRFLVEGLTQRPMLHQVRSPYALVNRLILTPAIFSWLTRPAPNGEFDLGYAVHQQAQSLLVVGVEISGHWVTVGDPENYLLALQTAADYHCA